jgi:adenylosuccinate synthase
LLPGWPRTDASSDLPAALSEYIALIEQAVEAPVRIVSLGPDRSRTVMRGEPAVTH